MLTPLIKDEPLLEDKLAPKGSRGSMAWVTKPGMRAFTIHTPSLASGVAGFVMPGDRVDVLLTMGGETRTAPAAAARVTLLQNIEVMAVDQTIEAPAENKVDINHAPVGDPQVTPDQSLKLELGQNRGTLHLSLRNPEDSEDAKTKTATLAELRVPARSPRRSAEPPLRLRLRSSRNRRLRRRPSPSTSITRRTRGRDEHRNDGTSARRVLTEGSARMGIPPAGPRLPPAVQFR